MLALTVDMICTGFSHLAEHAGEVIRWQRLEMLSRSVALFGLTLFSLTYARYNYREFLRHWRWPLLSLSVILILVAIAGWRDFLTGVKLSDCYSGWKLELGRSGSVVLTLQVILATLALMNMEGTLKGAVGTLRWKVKFVSLGLGVVLAAQIYTSAQALILGALEPFYGEVKLAATAIGCTLVFISLQRTSFGRGDLYISTHLLFRSFSALAIGGYLVLIGMISKIFSTGDTGRGFFPIKIVILFLALVALGVVMLSDRVRQKARILLSRNLLRPRYDHRQVWATLISRTSQATDAASFCRETANWISDTFEILSVTIWCIDEPMAKLSFGGSTRASESTEILPSGEAIEELTRGLRKNGDLIDLEVISNEWVELIKRISPDIFNLGGPRICLPLLAGQDLVGMMVLTDRVQRLRLTAEELDLFKTIAAHVAARLFVYRLSEQVLQAKQMEAFQSMSAFFVHDLKNTASTLSLMLQNLPHHFDDRAFREDALRAVSKSVDKINGMIAKLALFRQGISITSLPANLNGIVTSALAEVAMPEGIEVHRELTPIPAIPLDSEQIKKVIINLVLNACDAMRSGGKLLVKTEYRHPWVLLKVVDDGIGMSSDFLHQSLFHPFKTSKPQGLGIGLFHAKVIVESHGGRIEAESQQGKGSQFMVWLPIKGGTSESSTANC